MVKPAWDKFKLLMWKNWLIQLRHKMQTVVEILVPVAFACLLIYIRSLVEPFTEKRRTRFQPLPLDLIPTSAL